MVKKISSLIAVIIVIIITIMTIVKINKRHEEKLYNVLYSEIRYKANRCNLEGKCDKTIVLSELYEKGYLEVQYDPITKEELNKNIKITITKDSIKIEN